MSKRTVDIEPMLDLKEVASTIGVHKNTMVRHLRSPKFQRTIGAKKLGGQWRFIRWRVEMYASTT